MYRAASRLLRACRGIYAKGATRAVPGSCPAACASTRAIAHAARWLPVPAPPPLESQCTNWKGVPLRVSGRCATSRDQCDPPRAACGGSESRFPHQRLGLCTIC